LLDLAPNDTFLLGEQKETRRRLSSHLGLEETFESLVGQAQIGRFESTIQ
ncbi:MAG: hypothetical protein QOJ04_1936, partial [Caballeronia sp.]|nr:hypothetical protein [Caballeronia sp.]